MPAFSFEKISPPARRGVAAAAPQKPRSVINQMIDRIAERRAKRAAVKSKKSQPIGSSSGG
ncbi:hypothetical protein XH83_28485 [Bradyrhizobium sp. CCBAU 53351]|uniref:hypothetical protein n=1 Tax=Bradyrhizobium sp. CCBAU 53351 TaxID=1325114 RepID=UPI0018894CF8|nr:hypothetical protein [Bradyrhizobium sp. CCBAU 53351]QOZ78995.1 hypothetical protein XH83_28485 [Bradyrhizobium sp. CCBAU 53351]